MNSGMRSIGEATHATATTKRNLSKRPTRGSRINPRSSDGDSDPADVFSSEFHLAGMQAGPDLDPELLDGGVQCARTLNSAPGPVERREGAVAGVLDVATAELLDITRNDLVVLVEDLA